MESNVNRHILDYLDYYVGLANAPQFAVLIAGRWGSGKTWIAREHAASVHRRQDGTRIFHISLYGVKSARDIDNLILEQFYPHKEDDTKGQIARLRSLFGDIASRRFTGGSIDSLGIVSLLLEFTLKPADHVLVFDDLERISMSLRETMGYINRFVEHRGFRVIVIANEDEFAASAESTMELDDYWRIKEKLIGKTMRVTSTPGAATTSFIDAIANPRTAAFLRANIDVIFDVYSNSACENLRSIRLAIFEFARLFRCIEERHVARTEMMRLLLAQFLAYTFEIQAGSISPHALHTIQDGHFHAMAMRALDKDMSEDGASSIVSKYPAAELDQPLVPAQIWTDCFARGTVNATRINDALAQSRYCYEDNTPNWKRILDVWSFRDDEFFTLLDVVRGDFRNHRYESAGEVKHIAGLLLWLATNDMVDDDRATLLADAQSYADHLMEQGLLHDVFDEFGRFADDDNYAGMSYWGNGIPEFAELCKYFRLKAAEARIAAMPHAGAQLLELMHSDVGLFVRRLVLSNSPDNIYYNQPVLAHVAPADFVNALLAAPPGNWRLIAHVFKERYAHRQFAEVLQDELPWLGEVRGLLNTALATSGKLSAHRIRSMLHNYIDHGITDLRAVGAPGEP